MIVTRLVSRASKPILCSICTRVVPIRCSVSPRVVPILVAAGRKITTDNHVKLGNVGGKIKAPDPSRCLDIYLGMWVHDPKQALEMQGQIAEHDRRQQEILKELDIKNYIQYTRNNGLWRVEQGFVGAGRTLSYEFILGEMFMMLYPDNNYVKTLVYMDGQRMIWAFYPVETPDEVLRVKSEIEDNKLIWKTEYPDGLRSTRIYFRD
ncbi:unnamed protein product [Candidula unifasciata]|uniref:Uncharacterized protein n=1 Tax=Candidula unifasciata TaxID=100452 RepID=A0A8S3ZNT5_9EUPU|nr:unnamed protein product [Candidula unifasciata]